MTKLQTRCGTLECTVSGEGSPAVVLFNGAGMALDGWRALYPHIEKIARVLAWNRFGLEGSDAPDRMQSGAVVVASVRELLRYADIDPPYVLVGHSLGALYADLFARLHPEEVAAMLLLEPADPARVRTMDEKHLVRSLSKVQQLPPGAFHDNLQAEVDALDRVVREIEAAGPRPDVPVSVVRGERGHFPQLAEPELVLDALAQLLRRSRQAA